MIKKILIGIAVLVLIFAAVVATRPSHYRVERSAVLSAPPAKVFPLVNDFRKWETWSPWVELDPAAKNTFDGPASGVGAVFSWAGNKEVGEGRMTILESRPNELIRLKLEFFKPMPGFSFTEFTFKPEGKGTAVSWSMAGENDFFGKAMCLFMDMDKMIGGRFEQGLKSLDAAAKK